MKKVLLTITMAATLVGLSAFGQGNFIFSSGGRFVWNDTGATGVPGGAYNVAFLWSPSITATSAISGFHALTPTNNATGGGTQGSAYTVQGTGAAEWNAILSDPNFQLARDAGAANGIAVGTLTAVGGIAYNGGSPFGVTGTSTAGGSVNAFFIAWSNAYATPQLAQANGSVFGWSGVFRYDYANNVTAPTSLGTQAAANGPGDGHFGVVPVPEPTTFALAGLGAASLLIFRRRK
jgi:hypothetical protein